MKLCVDGFFSKEIAKEVGVNAAVVVNTLDFWIQDTEHGVWKDGVKYIFNTYDKWQEQLYWLTTRTIKNLFKKLVNLGILIQEKYGKGYDHRQMWTLNYSHPVVKKFHRQQGKNFTTGSEKISPPYNTYNTKEKQQIPTPVGNSFTPSVRDPYQTSTRSNGELKEHKVSPRSKPSRWDPKDWPEVEEWLASKNQDFRKQVWEHAEYNLLRPKKEKVIYPEAYKKGIVWKSWKDDTKGTSESDFKFVDKTGLKPAPVVRSIPVPYYKKMKADMSFDDEMELLYEQGGIHDG